MSKDNNKYDDFDDEFEFEDDQIQIDWTNIFRKLYAHRKLFIISFFATILIVYPLARTIPKYYAVNVTLAPEFSTLNSSSSSSSLSSLMRTFGIGTSTNTNVDALLPTLYPDLMNSTSFRVSLFNVPVQTKDGKIKTTYYQYLAEYQKAPIWNKAIGALLSLIPSDSEEAPKEKKDVNAGALTKPQAAIVGAIANNVVCDIDEKTGVISIAVKEQDPVVCATIADSTCQHLQEFVTEYRTKKARINLQNAQKQYAQAKAAYEAAKGKVESFNDSNWDLVDEDFIVEKQALENDMQLKFSNLSTFNQLMLNARSKYESMRPVFTILNGASVPLKPAGPSRMKVVFVFLILVLGGEVAWILFKDKTKEKIASIKQTPEA